MLSYVAKAFYQHCSEKISVMFKMYYFKNEFTVSKHEKAFSPTIMILTQPNEKQLFFFFWYSDWLISYRVLNR